MLVIDKPEGPTSHDVVMAVKKRLKAKKVGHIGTLDPMATGALPLCMNEATKLARFFETGEKEYFATFRLGEETDSHDRNGKIVARGDITSLTKEDILSAMLSFTGRIQQTPPMFSAVKKDGVPLYRLARQGVEIERAPREVDIYRITVQDVSLPLVTATIVCSRGTYIRSLAFDIGKKLGCGAHLVGLRRTRSGIFSLSQSLSLDDIKNLEENRIKSNIIPLERLFAETPEVEIDAAMANRILDGIQPSIEQFSSKRIFSSFAEESMVRFTLQGRIVALARYKNQEGFKLERVFKNSEQ